jgi:hypothetical protein
MSDTQSEPALKLDLKKEVKFPTAVLAADCSGQHAFAACFDGVYRVDLESGEHHLVGRHDSYASGACFLPNSALLVTSGYDGTLRWHDPAALTTVRVVQAHRFWSWQLDASPDEKFVASVTGQYLPGGYKYEPAPETEPCVKVFDAASGELLHSFSHQPPVLSVAFSPDSQHLAAANMMGEIRVWNLSTGRQEAAWTTPDFTSWGIIKSHHYIGGIFSLAFTPDGAEIVACGMGPMRDPMAGNGKQLWQRFAWRDAKKTAEIAEGDAGSGLMESLVFHPTQSRFVMAGRLAQGKWNTAIFENSGKLLHSLDAKMRVTDTIISGPSHDLLLAGAVGQERKKNGQCPPFGRLKLYSWSAPAAQTVIGG